MQIISLLVTAKINGLELHAWLASVLQNLPHLARIENMHEVAASVVLEYIEFFYNQQQPSRRTTIEWLHKKEQMVVSAIISTPHEDQIINICKQGNMSSVG